MKTLITIVGVVVILLAGTIGYLVNGELNKPVEPPGSVSMASEYHYTQFTGEIATSTHFSNTSTFGSVIITEDFAGALVFLDATSTSAYALANGTRIADLQSALTEGVYTFDVALSNDLVMVSDDGFVFAGDISVTWR